MPTSVVMQYEQQIQTMTRKFTEWQVQYAVRTGVGMSNKRVTVVSWRFIVDSDGDWLINWLSEHGLMSPPHSIGYTDDGFFTGQKTQPTVSKYWRNM